MNANWRAVFYTWMCAVMAAFAVSQPIFLPRPLLVAMAVMFLGGAVEAMFQHHRELSAHQGAR